MLLEGRLDELQGRNAEACLEILSPGDWRADDLESPGATLVEIVVAPRSTWLGQTLRDARFREKYGMTVGTGEWADRSALILATCHCNRDALLLQVSRGRIPLLRTEPDLIVLDESTPERVTPPSRQKSWLARAIMAGAVLFAGVQSTVGGRDHAGLSPARWCLLGVPRWIRPTPPSSGAPFSWWRYAIFGPRDEPERGGSPDRQWAGGVFLPMGAIVLLAGLFVTTTLMTQMMPRAAVAAILAPIAIQTAQQAGLNPRSLAMAVAGDLNGLHNTIGASGECAGDGAGWLSLSRFPASGAAAYCADVWGCDDPAANFLAVDREVGRDTTQGSHSSAHLNVPQPRLSASTPITPAATAASAQRLARNWLTKMKSTMIAGGLLTPRSLRSLPATRQGCARLGQISQRQRRRPRQFPY